MEASQRSLRQNSYTPSPPHTITINTPNPTAARHGNAFQVPLLQEELPDDEATAAGV